jgi:hypothetical protein
MDHPSGLINLHLEMEKLKQNVGPNADPSCKQLIEHMTVLRSRFRGKLLAQRPTSDEEKRDESSEDDEASEDDREGDEVDSYEDAATRRRRELKRRKARIQNSDEPERVKRILSAVADFSYEVDSLVDSLRDARCKLRKRLKDA